jgi:hypothetical protein
VGHQEEGLGDRVAATVTLTRCRSVDGADDWSENWSL